MYLNKFMVSSRNELMIALRIYHYRFVHPVGLILVVLFLELLGVFLASSVLNGSQSADESEVFKHYSNRKGDQVIEVDSENSCHIFDNSHARWMLRTRRDSVISLNAIQFQLLLQKCQLDSSQRRQPGDLPFRNGSEENAGTKFGNENDLNQNLILTMLNESMPGSLQPQFIPHGFLFNESDVYHFMSEATNNSSLVDSNSTSTGESGPPLIFPGTKWCGRGNISSSDDDVGFYAETDKCCRNHDKCHDSLAAGECKHGLCNSGSYTRSLCSCDQEFLDCLDNDRSFSVVTSFKIANLYFNILRPNCIARRHPVSSCNRRRLTGECIAYRYRFDEPTSWQFFSAQPYIVREARQLLHTIISPPINPRLIPTSIPLPPLPGTSLITSNDLSLPKLGNLGDSLSQNLPTSFRG